MRELRKCVVQLETKGCQIACIATILGKKYWDVSRQFKQDFNKKGLAPIDAAAFLSGFGFDIIYKLNKCYNDYKTQNKRMLIPFADIHIVSMEQFADVKDNHAVIMTKSGRLLCPSTGKELVEQYLSISCVFGYWYPKNWKGTK